MVDAKSIKTTTADAETVSIIAAMQEINDPILVCPLTRKFTLARGVVMTG